MAELYQPTGFEPVDSLKGLQVIADKINDPSAKVAHVRKALKLMGAGALLEHQFMVGANEIWAKQPDEPSDLIHFTEGLLFIGQLDAFSYMLDPDVPIDSLSLNFTMPEVWGVASEDVEQFKALKFQVPVLAIDSYLSAEAA